MFRDKPGTNPFSAQNNGHRDSSVKIEKEVPNQDRPVTARTFQNCNVGEGLWQRLRLTSRAESVMFKTVEK